MRNFILAGAVLLTTLFAFKLPSIVNSESSAPKMAVFEWQSLTHDFGALEQNKPASHKFQFTNTGEAPLIITEVKGSCGCTVTEYSKEPIAPGESGFVKATYNAKKTGVFNKTVRVTANVEGGPETLTIKGKVIEKERI